MHSRFKSAVKLGFALVQNEFAPSERPGLPMEEVDESDLPGGPVRVGIVVVHPEVVPIAACRDL